MRIAVAGAGIACTALMTMAGATLLAPDTGAQTPCHAVSPATSPPAQCIAMTNPDAAGLAIWGVRGGPAGGTPETEWYDYLGNPIATMGQSGGFKVFGDEICAYPPGNVLTPAACLEDNGTILVGGQTLDPADISWIHSAEAASARK